jgi:hypothetical protein
MDTTFRDGNYFDASMYCWKLVSKIINKISEPIENQFTFYEILTLYEAF